VVWGDGKITYNGREIPTVLVNGKPFFGTDKSIALQNIAKDAVKKIQVYDRRGQEERDNSPFEAQHEMNVVLKEGKERMYFGNATVGGGTDGRYEGHFNMNHADKQTQATVAYSLNNVNKNLTSIDQLLRNTTFKGAGIRNDFNPDFLRSGITRQHVFGGRYQYDFLVAQELGRKNILVGSVLGNRYATTVRDVSETQSISESTGESNVRRRTQQSDRDQLADRADLRYDYQGKRGKRTVTADMDVNLVRHPYARMAWRRAEHGAEPDAAVLYACGQDYPLHMHDAKCLASAETIDSALLSVLSSAGIDAVCALYQGGQYQTD